MSHWFIGLKFLKHGSAIEQLKLKKGDFTSANEFWNALLKLFKLLQDGWFYFGSLFKNSIIWYM